MQLLENKTTISSLELVEQINIFRAIDLNKSELEHKNLLTIIRDEFEEEISQLEIQPSEYESRGKNYPMFVLSLGQAKQVLVRESKVVRKAVIAYIEKLENALKKEYTVKELLTMQLETLERAELAEQKVENLTITLDSSLEWCTIVKCSVHNKIHEKLFDWRVLKKKSEEMGYIIKKLPSTRFGFQNAYHVNCFRACYPKYNYNFNKYLGLI